jgi:hypothetical protein
VLCNKFIFWVRVIIFMILDSSVNCSFEMDMQLQFCLLILPLLLVGNYDSWKYTGNYSCRLERICMLMLPSVVSPSLLCNRFTFRLELLFNHSFKVGIFMQCKCDSGYCVHIM